MPKRIISNTFYAPPQDPHKDRLHTYTEKKYSPTLKRMVDMRFSVEDFGPMTSEEIVQWSEAPAVARKGAWAESYQGRAYIEARDTARAWLGLDVPLGKSLPLEHEAECSNCYTTKPLTDFGRDDRKVNGRKSVCRECDNRMRVRRYFRMKERKSDAA